MQLVKIVSEKSLNIWVDQKPKEFRYCNKRKSVEIRPVKQLEFVHFCQSPEQKLMDNLYLSRHY